MSWKKHFTVYQGKPTANGKGGSNGSTHKYQSWLPELYSGIPNRVERYIQYDQMDMDSEINAALDTIAEFSTQFDDDTGSPFQVVWKNDPTESESKVLEQTLRQWNNINDWDRRIFKTFRNVIKYGDQPFIRDPETWILHYCDPADLMSAVINENESKEIEQYVINNIDLNIANKTATDPVEQHGGLTGGGPRAQSSTMGPQSYNGAATHGVDETVVDSTHVVHIALTEGMDVSWPFGTSILDPIFKTYKQKELLEDAIIIYRVQRAPERRVFYIDVGNMPTHKAMGFVERVKNEIHQRRIPNKTGGGQNMVDAQYNPLSMMEDYFFAQTAEGRGSKVEVLPGGANLGEIDDLKFFTNKMMRALRVPSSYNPTGPEEQSSTYQDGKVGTAFIQEFRFTKYCQRLQNTIQPVFDKEFKLFLKNRGFHVDANSFELKFYDPQSFSQYREIDIDAARANVFQSIDGIPYLSKRFKLEKYLGLTPDEILQNERMVMEEQGGTGKDEMGMGLGDVGVQYGDEMDFSDLDDIGDMEDTEDMGGDEAPPSPDEEI